MSSGLARMGPYPARLRRHFSSISLEEAFRQIHRSGAVVPIPTPTDLTLVLSDGGRLLIEPYRDEEGGLKVGYHFLSKEEVTAGKEIPSHSKKEVTSGPTPESFGTPNSPRTVA